MILRPSLHKFFSNGELTRFAVAVFLSSLLLLTLTGCLDGEKKNNPTIVKPSPHLEMGPLHQLTGIWKNEQSGDFEHWTKQSDSSFSAVVYSVKNQDTTLLETADIYSSDSGWVFRNFVVGQNQGKAIEFISSFLSPESIQFSNPTHDFPNHIRYTLSGNDHLTANITGLNSKGTADTIFFNYTRIR